jgi:hypothetical protein
LVPPNAVTVIVAVPGAFANMFPVEPSVTALVLLLCQLTALFVAFEGVTVAPTSHDEPTVMIAGGLLRIEMPVTGTVAATTVTV